MNSEQWKRIEEVFEAIIDAPAEERPALLVQVCGRDGELRREVESLLAADRGYLAAIEAAISNQAADLAVSGEELVGKRLGVWRLTAVIGHGGMGTVYRAVRDDKAFEKEAALKVIRRGMDSATVIASFRRERQILARLDHPHIARLLGDDRRGASVLRHGVRRRQPDHRVLRPERLERAAAVATLPRVLRRCPVRAWQPGRSSRPEAGEHPGHAGGNSEAARLRPAEGGESGDDRGGDDDGPPDATGSFSISTTLRLPSVQR